MIDISHCDKAAVLAALYNRARVQGMGFLSARPGDMKVEEARVLLAKSERFDYVHGRVVKVDLGGATPGWSRGRAGPRASRHRDRDRYRA
jgi:hypothetical protein